MNIKFIAHHRAIDGLVQTIKWIELEQYFLLKDFHATRVPMRDPTQLYVLSALLI